MSTKPHGDTHEICDPRALCIACTQSECFLSAGQAPPAAGLFTHFIKLGVVGFQNPPSLSFSTRVTLYLAFEFHVPLFASPLG